MTERPILFSRPMVQAILAGRKTQTRRVITPQPFYRDGRWRWKEADLAWNTLCKCLYGAVGDRLWVRETWADVNTESGPALLYRADNYYHWCSDDAFPVEYERYPNCQFTMWCGDLLRGEPGHVWRSPGFMFKWAARLWLEITGIRVERVRDISYGDEGAEGITLGPECNDRHSGFIALWDAINAKRGYGWDVNPYVWVLEFKRVEARP